MCIFLFLPILYLLIIGRAFVDLIHIWDEFDALADDEENDNADQDTCHGCLLDQKKNLTTTSCNTLDLQSLACVSSEFIYLFNEAVDYVTGSIL